MTEKHGMKPSDFYNEKSFVAVLHGGKYRFLISDVANTEDNAMIQSQIPRDDSTGGVDLKAFYESAKLKEISDYLLPRYVQEPKVVSGKTPVDGSAVSTDDIPDIYKMTLILAILNGPDILGQLSSKIESFRQQ